MAMKSETRAAIEERLTSVRERLKCARGVEADALKDMEEDLVDKLDDAQDVPETSDADKLAARVAIVNRRLGNVVTDPKMLRPVEFLLPDEAARATEELRRVLTVHNRLDLFDAYQADRLGLFGGAPMLRMVAPSAGNPRPHESGTLAERFVATRVEDAVTMLLDDEINPESLLRDLMRARATADQRRSEELRASYEKTLEQQKRARVEGRILEWSERNPVARAFIRIAQESDMAPHASLLRRLAAAIEAEPRLARQLPPNDADRPSSGEPKL